MKPRNVEPKAVVFSQWIFKRLLSAYPKAHRQEYGPAMAQVFSDQCRDAWSNACWRGLAALWLRVLPDLVKTSVLEHIAAIKGRKLMTIKTTVFLAVSVPVFFLVIMTAAVVTFLVPKVYSSKACIKVQNDAAFAPSQGVGSNVSGAYDSYYIQTELAVIKSELVLDPVVDLLDLNTRWGKKFLVEGKLKTAESRAILRGRLQLRPVPNTRLIDITVYSDDNREAAEIANAVADVYRHYNIKQRGEANEAARVGKVSQQSSAATRVPLVEILDLAMPGPKPVRPNVPLNLFLGAIIGMFTALVVGGVAALLTGIFVRKKPAAV